MSNTKLTVTISDAEIVVNAKAYAKEQGQSLSSLVEEHLKSLTSEDQRTYSLDKELPPLVKSLSGAAGTLPEDWNHKEALLEILEEKYLKE